MAVRPLCQHVLQPTRTLAAKGQVAIETPNSGLEG
jgi:hypothetical protein